MSDSILHVTTVARSGGIFAWRFRAIVLAIAIAPMESTSAFSVGPQAGLNCVVISGTCVASAILANNLSAYVENHQLITKDALDGTALTFTPPSTGNYSASAVSFTQPALMAIEDANAEVDYNQADHSFHFDNEFLSSASVRVITGREDIIDQLSTAITAEQAQTLRTLLGGYLHTLQDFFAHSSWVNISPPPSTAGLPPFVLGDPSAALESPGGSFIACKLNDTSALYDLSSVTSGYAGSITNLLNAVAPPQKCAHGLIDNGIHKDWSGRSGYDAARAWAVLATTAYVKAIINDPGNNKDSVCMLMTDSPCLTLTIPPFAPGQTVGMFIGQRNLFADQITPPQSCSAPTWTVAGSSINLSVGPSYGLVDTLNSNVSTLTVTETLSGGTQISTSLQIAVNGDLWFWSSNSSELDTLIANTKGAYAIDGPAYYIATTQIDPTTNTVNPNLIPLYRYINNNTASTHFWTAYPEREILTGWNFEEQTGWVFNTPTSGAQPVYRFYNSTKNVHFWSFDSNGEGELSNGFQAEGIVFYSIPAGSAPQMIPMIRARCTLCVTPPETQFPIANLPPKPAPCP